MAYYNGKQIVGFKINQINKQMDIDQQFKPQSPNAQSGTAVKQAVDEAMESIYDNIGNINASNAESVSITNQNTPLTFWLGSENEYNSLELKKSNCLHIITDDNDTEKIVGQGETDDGWTYRKWSSGKIELWTNNIPFTINWEQLGPLYFSSKNSISVPMVTDIEYVNGDSTYWHYANWSSVTKSGTVEQAIDIRYYSINDNGNGDTINFSAYIIGRWK